MARQSVPMLRDIGPRAKLTIGLPKDAYEKATAFADEHGHTILELAIGALLVTPGIASVIIGATTPEQLQQNIASAGWRLTEADLRRLHATLA